jgi:hypothetical protein
LRRLALIIGLTVAATVLGAGCATRCEKEHQQCSVECRRNYQLCQSYGNDEYYCRNFIGNCTVQCDDAKRTCHSYWP